MNNSAASGHAVRLGLVAALVTIGIGQTVYPASLSKTGEVETKVDFAYAFGFPHRMTVALPDSSHKTIIDVYADHLGFRWTYGNLLNVPLAAYMPLNCNWSGDLWLEVDGHRPAGCAYGRSEGYLPVLRAEWHDTNGLFELEVVGGASAAITRTKVTNHSDLPHRYNLVFAINGSFGEVPGYINQGDPQDYVLAGWLDRADRVLALVEGADTPLRKDHPAKTLALEWNLKPGETGTGWLVRPYQGYEGDIIKLRSHNWAAEFEQGKEVWRQLLGRAVQFAIPDRGIRNAYYASLGDIFIMREPVAQGYIASSPGTEGYRCSNAAEAGVAAIGLDQAGLPSEATLGYQMCLDQQGENGDWNDPQGWSHRCWGIAGFKAWTALEHYRLTRDLAYLERVFPHLLANSRWQEKQRARTRVMENGQRPLYYGLLPRGQGDCGLDAGDGWYGYFLPHNMWAVFADQLAVEAADKLARNDERDELRAIYERAHQDLLTATRNGAISEKDYRWIPGSPGNPAGSRWGVLNAAFPCGLLSPDDELITGTLRYMNQRLSPGGLQIHTGWMTNGMWVAISLDNVAEVELARNHGDEAVRLLYASLNHGTPLYTWCEERGQEPGTDKTSGDRQHLWTPVAVVRVIRDCLIMEEDQGLHLARGIARSWLAGGKMVGVTNAPTHFGAVSYAIQYDSSARQVTGRISFPKSSAMRWSVLHIPLPSGLTLKLVNAESGASMLPDRSGLKWTDPAGEVHFEAQVQ